MKFLCSVMATPSVIIIVVNVIIITINVAKKVIILLKHLEPGEVPLLSDGDPKVKACKSLVRRDVHCVLIHTSWSLWWLWYLWYLVSMMLLMILLKIGNSRTQNNYPHVVQGAPHRASKMWQCWKDISLVKLLWVILHHYQHNFNHQYLWTCVDWCWRWRETCCYAELSLPRGLHLINSLLHLSWWYLLKYCPHHIKLLDCCHHHDHYKFGHLQFFLPPQHLCISSKLPLSLSPTSSLSS